VRDQIIDAYEAWNEAFNRGDAGAVAALYTENAKLLPPTHQVVEGQRAIEAFWDGLLRAGVTGHRLELIAAEGDQRGAVGAARWSARGKGGDGGDQTFTGSAVHVFERQQGGGLKLWLHTWN
jgi:ketosteroid isomerase-like protein